MATEPIARAERYEVAVGVTLTNDQESAVVALVIKIGDNVTTLNLDGNAANVLACDLFKNASGVLWRQAALRSELLAALEKSKGQQRPPEVASSPGQTGTRIEQA